MPLLDDLARYLEDQGVAQVGIDLYKSDLPDTGAPDLAIGLIEYEGRPPGRLLGQTGYSSEEGRLHVIVRAPTYQSAMATARAVLHAFSLINGETLTSGVRYLGVEALQSPFDVGPDPSNRALVACNYAVHREAE